MTYLSQTHQTQKSYRSYERNENSWKKHNTKLFYKDVDGNDTFLLQRV